MRSCGGRLASALASLAFRVLSCARRCLGRHTLARGRGLWPQLEGGSRAGLSLREVSPRGLEPGRPPWLSGGAEGVV